MSNVKTLRIVILQLFCSIMNCKASYPLFGQCRQHHVMRGFNATKYSGDWYEFEKYFSFADYGVRCSTVRLSEDLSLNNGSVFSYSKRFMSGDSKIVEESGTLTASTSNLRLGEKLRGSLSLKRQSLEKSSSQNNTVEIDPYWILGTDYHNYSIVWSCFNHGWINFQSATVLTRVRDPTNKIRGQAYGVMLSYGLMTKLLVQVDHTDCPEDIFVIPNEPLPPPPQLKQPAIKMKAPSHRVKQRRPRPKHNWVNGNKRWK